MNPIIPAQAPVLHLVPYAPQRFLVTGDATQEPIQAIVPAEGIGLPEEPGGRRPFRLKILHLNDLHGHVVKFMGDRSRPVFSRIVWQVEETRQQWANKQNGAFLFLTGGDDMAGSILDELLHHPTPLHAGYHLYSAAGVDAGVVGNHDLDRGVAQLVRVIEHDAGFPLLSANLFSPSLPVYPAALFLVKGVRVGLVGLTTQAQIKCEKDDITIADPVQTLHHLLPALRPLCDVLIVLSHLGRSLREATADVHSAGDVELALSLPPGAVDLIVGGHTHQALNPGGLEAINIVNGIPIVQAGATGQYLGEVTLTITDRAAVTDARLVNTDDLPAEEAFERDWIQPLLYALAPIFNRELGRIDRHPDLSTEAIHNDFAAGESALANFITEGMVAQCRRADLPVDLAMIDGSVVRQGLPPRGRLTFRDWFNLMPTVDTIRLCRLTGRQLRELIHDNAYRLARPDEPRTESGFLHFSRALRYTVYLGRRRSEALAEGITIHDQPLDELETHQFVVACHSFLRIAARSWEQSPAVSQLPLVDVRRWAFDDTGLFLREELLAYIRACGGVTAAGGATRNDCLRIRYPIPSGQPQPQRFTNVASSP